MRIALRPSRRQGIACLLLLIGSAAAFLSARSVISAGCAQATFRSAGVFTVGTAPRSIATGDFNGDNRPDFVTGNYDSDDVSVYVSNQLNDLVNIGNFHVGAHPRSVATGDFNGDLKTDIVTANDTDRQVALILNNGAGGFSIPSKVNLLSEGLHAAVSDFNNDGTSDVAVATSVGIKILLGDGMGSLFVTSAPGTADFLVVGDFDSDGDPDLAANHSQVLRNNGAGTFTIVPSCSSMTFDSIAAGDFNGDGKLFWLGQEYLKTESGQGLELAMDASTLRLALTYRRWPTLPTRLRRPTSITMGRWMLQLPMAVAATWRCFSAMVSAI